MANLKTILEKNSVFGALGHITEEVMEGQFLLDTPEQLARIIPDKLMATIYSVGGCMVLYGFTQLATQISYGTHLVFGAFLFNTFTFVEETLRDGGVKLPLPQEAALFGEEYI